MKIFPLVFLLAPLATASAAVTMSPSSGSVLSGSSVTFQWSAASGTNPSYQFWIGTTNGSDNLSPSSCLGTTATTCTVTDLPTNGATIYGLLYSEASGKWSSSTYTWTAASSNSSAPTLTGLSCASTSFTGAGTTSCTAALSAAASASTIVSLASNSSAVTVPSSVTIAAGAASASFTATVPAFTSSQSVILTATYAGVSKTATLTLTVSTGSSTCGHSYSTAFPSPSAPEDPISEDGNWINGGTTGLEWSNVQTTTGHAFGTAVNGAPPYNDSTAVLAGGPWCQNQTAQATLMISATDSSSQEEVELRLNTTVTANSITGYEGDVSVLSGNLYFVWARWNGPLNSYCYIHDGTCNSTANVAAVQVHNGDVLMATNVNGLLTLYDNGTAIITATDTTYTAGTPGMGFWNVGGTTADLAHYGFSNFSATDGTAKGTNNAPPPDVVLSWTPPTAGTLILLKAQVASASECSSVASWMQITLAAGASSYTDDAVTAGDYYCYGIIVNVGGAYSAVSNIIEAEVTSAGGTIVDLSAPVPVSAISGFNGSLGTQ